MVLDRLLPSPSWDTAPPGDDAFLPGDLARLHDATCADAPGTLDDPTWRDLLLDRYLDVVGAGASLFGRQALYRRLRAGASACAPAGGQADARARVTALLGDPARLAALERTLVPLRHARDDVATLLFADRAAAPPPPPWLRWVLLPVALALGIACALHVVPPASPLGWLFVGAALYLLVAIQLGHEDRVDAWRDVLLSLRVLLRGVVLQDGAAAPRAAQLSRALAPSAPAGGVSGVGEYGKWFLAANVRHYYRTVALVWRERAFLRACYLDLAEAEADAALARHLRAAHAGAGRGRPSVAGRRAGPVVRGRTGARARVAGFIRWPRHMTGR